MRGELEQGKGRGGKGERGKGRGLMDDLREGYDRIRVKRRGNATAARNRAEQMLW